MDSTTPDSPAAAQAAAPQPKWKPLNRVQRRVAGVLVEKAKTTPENYPLSLNAVTTGCNQKSNRSPQMELASEEVEMALDELRTLGAAIEVQGSGRVAKYKHLLYEWLGVDKVELAVMAELLLRGEQTVGELRGRAARMEPIASLDDLRPVLESLQRKQLIVSLTPPGRGQIVTHNLYEPHELQRLRAQAASGGWSEEAGETDSRAVPAPQPGSSAISRAQYDELRGELDELRGEVTRLAEAVDELRLRLG